jgi:hypothetical protein
MSKKQATPSFEIGARVQVLKGVASGLTGTLEAATQSGWLVVLLDSAPEGVTGIKDGKVSVRAASLAPYTAGIDLDKILMDDEAIEAFTAKEEGEEGEAPLTLGQLMARTLKQARVRYVKAKTVNGVATAHCNDPIAQELLGLEPVEVAALADRVLGVPAGTHISKYGHLNPGQIRMNSGNRIRAYWKALLEGDNPEDFDRVMKLLNMEKDEEQDEEEGDE